METLASRLKHLRDYLNVSLDPYDFFDYLGDFVKAETGRRDDAVDDDPHEAGHNLTPEGMKRFETWLVTSRIVDRAIRDMPAEQPAYVYFSSASLVPKTTWLVHFTDDPSAIAEQGFVYGQEDVRRLGLTTHFVDRVRKSHEGWNFAFEAKNAPSGRGKYGEHVVLFQAPAVLAYHTGDEERQAIFWGPSVRCVIPIYRSSDADWEVGERGWAHIDDAIEYAKEHGQRLRVCSGRRRKTK
jgi:hypothetical protein